MRIWTAALLVMMGGCASGSPTLRTGWPTLPTAQAALASGAPDLALRICGGLLESSPRNVDLLNCQGDALGALGRTTEAETSFHQALHFEARSEGALIGLGRISLAERPAEAEALFLQVLERRPHNALALNDLGIAQDLQGRHDAAQTVYGKAIAAAPELRAAQINLALSLALSGHGEEAIRLARPITNTSDATIRERHILAAVLGMAGHTEEAARLLQADLSTQQVEQALAGYSALIPR